MDGATNRLDINHLLQQLDVPEHIFKEAQNKANEMLRRIKSSCRGALKTSGRLGAPIAVDLTLKALNVPFSAATLLALATETQKRYTEVHARVTRRLGTHAHSGREHTIDTLAVTLGCSAQHKSAAHAMLERYQRAILPRLGSGAAVNPSSHVTLNGPELHAAALVLAAAQEHGGGGGGGGSGGDREALDARDVASAAKMELRDLERTIKVMAEHVGCAQPLVRAASAAAPGRKAAAPSSRKHGSSRGAAAVMAAGGGAAAAAAAAASGQSRKRRRVSAEGGGDSSTIIGARSAASLHDDTDLVQETLASLGVRRRSSGDGGGSSSGAAARARQAPDPSEVFALLRNEPPPPLFLEWAARQPKVLHNLRDFETPEKAPSVWAATMPRAAAADGEAPASGGVIANGGGGGGGGGGGAFASTGTVASRGGGDAGSGAGAAAAPLAGVNGVADRAARLLLLGGTQEGGAGDAADVAAAALPALLPSPPAAGGVSSSVPAADAAGVEEGGAQSTAAPARDTLSPAEDVTDTEDGTQQAPLPPPPPGPALPQRAEAEVNVAAKAAAVARRSRLASKKRKQTWASDAAAAAAAQPPVGTPARAARASDTAASNAITCALASGGSSGSNGACSENDRHSAVNCCGRSSGGAGSSSSSFSGCRSVACDKGNPDPPHRADLFVALGIARRNALRGIRPQGDRARRLCGDAGGHAPVAAARRSGCGWRGLPFAGAQMRAGSAAKAVVAWKPGGDDGGCAAAREQRKRGFCAAFGAANTTLLHCGGSAAGAAMLALIAAEFPQRQHASIQTLLSRRPAGASQPRPPAGHNAQGNTQQAAEAHAHTLGTAVDVKLSFVSRAAHDREGAAVLQHNTLVLINAVNGADVS
ncbi:hypothetical protein JKP88DRAFT_275578 [Tribonema minus]|uniref:Uncharacterized protein n=1 Tax=Tribonema minus TaxID=303371 RepID=A0A835Z8F1_9STRA|nr:hypothetical protein JKP88DRAFT_275578 [Tribonema minus]